MPPEPPPLSTFGTMTEPGYIRTVLVHEHFTDSSTLALPSEDRLENGSKGDTDRASRMHQQVQLTMAKKGTRRYAGDDSLYYASSVPDHAQYTARSMTHREFSPSSSKYYEGRKEYTSVGHENGWAGGNVSGNQWKTEQDTTPRRLLVRLEVSPERGTNSGEYRSNLGTSPRIQESRQYGGTASRYARSDIVGSNRFGASKSRLSSANRFYQTGSTRESEFANSVPTSPAGYLSQLSRNSRSMNNLLEKENYQSPLYAVGQVRQVIQPQAVSHKGQTMRSRWQQSTYRTTATGRESFQSATGGTAYDMGGKKPTFIGGTSGTARAGSTQVREVTQLETQGVNSPGISEVEMTLERAISLLETTYTNSEWIIAASSFIQHECFQKAEARRQVYSLGGIPRLLQLLNSNNEEVQRASCAALRNIVFEDNDNKLEVCEQRGIPIVLNLLKETQDVDTKRQITGLLWNLSSNDQLKSLLIRDALVPLTKNIIIPCSGWSEGDYSKSEMVSDADIFYNATGCLRNMSSAGPEGRKAMRECDGLIDSLVHYVRGCVADYKPDDRATENCVCILHNLSYQLESELPSSFTQNIYTYRQDLPQHEKNIGCFGSRSRRVKEQWIDTPLAEERHNPRGVEWLWHSIVIRMYLSLIAKSSRSYTQEASMGALQNLTAGKGPMPSAVAQLIVLKENGLQHIRNMLSSGDAGVKRTAVSLLRNLSRNHSLQNEIAKQLLPDLVRLLPDSAPESNITNDTTSSACYVLNNLVANSSANARTLLVNGGIQKLLNLSMSDCTLSTKTGKAASFVLYTLWLHQDLHNTYKKAQFKKTDFVNNRTTKAFHSLKD
ncbi:plakophilin-2 isoform X2 [Bombina bombina]|uniref:plakophilin-2 isoform X1 n=1 Tax=Bombina bombina TaxID=8345 RepID=UPI00235A700A|nr:plakophilin-2 isoform X1 [Bombina bombina]XP_053575037.1 plakophilin-2 isoform X2 [Bombina bombina]